MDNNTTNNKPYNRWIVFLLVATAIFMSTLDSSIVNVALPYIMEDFHTRMDIVQWVILSYLVTVSALLLFFGRLSDTRGRKIIYIYGFLIFTLGSFFCSIAPTCLVLILSRILQGLGASMLMACSPAMIIDAFPPGERGRALGMMGTIVAAGLTAGPVAGGILLDLFSWRSIFYINIPFGIIALFTGFHILTGTSADTGNNEPLDKKGSFFLIISICSFIIALTHLGKWELLSIKSTSLFFIFLISLLLFIKTETSTDFPLFDPGLLRIRLFLFPVITSAILFASLFTIIFLMPFYLTYPCAYSASATGFIMITPFIFLFFFSPFAGLMYDKIGSRMLCTVGMSFLAISLTSFLFINDSAGLFPVLLRLALAGTGTALFISPNNTAAMNSTPLEKRGLASGAVATARNLGMVMGISIAGLVFSLSYSRLTGGASLENYTGEMLQYFMTGFKRALAAGAAMAFTGILLAYMRGDDKP